jgi:putative transposase
MRLYTNKTQENQIRQTVGCCRFVYNFFLNERIEHYKATNEMKSCYDLAYGLQFLRREYPWMKDVEYAPLNQTLRDIDTAYKRFFKGISDFPKFKSKKNNKQSFRTINIKNIDDKHISLPKIGIINVRHNFDLSKINKIFNATVSFETTGKFFVSLSTLSEVKTKQKTNLNVGIDLGLKEFATYSDGTVISRINFTKRHEEHLVFHQIKLARMIRGSNNYRKQKVKIARIHEKIRNQRADFIHKVTHNIVCDYDVICIEDLNASGMMKNKNLSKSIADVSFYEFKRQLEYKSIWYGKTLSKIDKWFPSSKLCSGCGNKKKDLTLADRTYQCSSCGLIIDRDLNASINILTAGTAGLA